MVLWLIGGQARLVDGEIAGETEICEVNVAERTRGRQVSSGY